MALYTALFVIYFTVRIKNTFFTIAALPTMLALMWFSAGGRKPSSIPNKDALLYMGIGIALVVGIVMYSSK